ncbi:uncharacterized protein LOC142327371 isoform X2 [Lycorma delicatula]
MVSNRFTILIVFYMVYNCQVNGEELKHIRQMYLNENEVIIELGKLLKKEFSNNCLGCISSFYSYESKRVQNIIEYMTTNNLNYETLPKENDIYISVKEIENNYEKYSNEVSWWNYLCELYKLQVSPPPKINYEEVVEKIGVDKLITKGNTEGLYKCINTFVTIINGKLLEKINNIYNENISTVEKRIQLSDTDQTRLNCLACIKTYISYENKRVENLLESIKKNESLETLLEGQNLILSKEIKLNFEKYMVGFLQWLNTCTRYKYSEESQLTKNIQEVVKKIGEGNLIKEGKTKGLNKCIDSYAKESTLINYVSSGKLDEIQTKYFNNIELLTFLGKPLINNKLSNSCLGCVLSFTMNEFERVKNIIEYMMENNLSYENLHQENDVSTSVKEIEKNFEIYNKEDDWWFNLCKLYTVQESKINYEEVVEKIGVDALIINGNTEGIYNCINTFVPFINGRLLVEMKNHYNQDISSIDFYILYMIRDHFTKDCLSCIKKYILYENERINKLIQTLKIENKTLDILLEDGDNLTLAKEIKLNYEKYKIEYSEWLSMCIESSVQDNLSHSTNVDDVVEVIGTGNLINKGNTEQMNNCINTFIKSNPGKLEKIQNKYLEYYEIVTFLGKPLVNNRLSNSCLGCISSFLTQEIKTIKNTSEDMIKNKLTYDTVNEDTRVSKLVEDIESNFKAYENENTWWIDLCIAHKQQYSPSILNYEEVVENIGADKLITKGKTEGILKCFNTFVTSINGQLLENIKTRYNESILSVGSNNGNLSNDQFRNNCVKCIKEYTSYEINRIQDILNNIRAQNKDLTSLIEDDSTLKLAKEIKLNYEKYNIEFSHWLNMCNKSDSQETTKEKTTNNVVTEIGIENFIKNGQTEGIRNCISNFVKL